MKISACIITLEEEDNITRCLSSLDFVDEIIIVDSGSKDRTIEFAKKYTDKIYIRLFDNYINQKNYCLSLTKNNWILFIDADEVISPELKNEILNINFLEYSNISSFLLPRLTNYMGHWVRHGGWYPNYQTKFFNKEKGKFTGILFHETVSVEGELKKLKYPILHYSYKNISDHLKFIDKYSSLFAEEKYKLNKKSSIFKSIYKGLWKFTWMYIVRFGFLDGKVGLILAILGGYYNFLKYIKLYEKEKMNV